MGPAEKTAFFDRAHLLSRVEGDASFLQELVAAFEESQKECVEGLRTAVGEGRAGMLEKHAHSLKGAVQNFASGRIVALAYSLELMGRNGACAGAAEALAELELELAGLRAYLRAL